MESLWQDCEGGDSWQMWPDWGLLEALWRPAFLDTTPFRERMHAQLDQESLQRELIISAVDYDTGKTIVFDNESMKTGWDIAESVISSASIPGFFVPNEYLGYHFGDGGIYANLQLTEAIHKCKEKGTPAEDIIVDIIMCQAYRIDMEEWTERESKFFNAWQLWNRKEFLKYYYSYYEDVTRVVRAFPEVQFRHLISPRQNIETDFIPMFDTREQIKGFFDIGY